MKGTILRAIFAVCFLLAFAPMVTSQTLITVDPAVTHQSFEGWGTSLCWWANTEGDGSVAYRNKIAEILMDPDSGLGYNIFRYNIGGGDQPGHDHLRTGGAIPGYKPTAAGAYDWTADPYQRNMVAAIAAKGVEKKRSIIWEAFSNSPPWWMTISGCAAGNTGGADNLRTDYFDDFADYLSEVVRHFRDYWGITFRTVEPFNEPSAGWWTINNNQEGCGFRAGQARMVKELGKSLTAKGLIPATAISAADENAVDQAVTGLAAYDDSAFSFMSQINTHTYYGRSAANFANLSALAAARNKLLWQSEIGPLAGTGTQDITMLMSQYIIQDLRMLKACAWLDWQSVGSGNWGTFQVSESTLALVPAKRYYLQAAFSRFIRPGAQFIQSSDSNSLAALVPSTGYLVLVIRNGGTTGINYRWDLTRFTRTGTSAAVYQFLVSQYQTLSRLSDIAISGRQFLLTSPAQSITTCLVPGVIDIVATFPSGTIQSPSAMSISAGNGHAVSIYLPSAGEYTLEIFNSSGRAVKTICNRGVRGSNKISLASWGLPNGAYLARLRQGHDLTSGILHIVK